MAWVMMAFVAFLNHASHAIWLCCICAPLFCSHLVMDPLGYYFWKWPCRKIEMGWTIGVIYTADCTLHNECPHKKTSLFRLARRLLANACSPNTERGRWLTQCARIRVPVVSMKIEKFKDLFRAALDRWWDSHESKNFGAGRTRQPIRPNFSTILPILGKI